MDDDKEKLVIDELVDTVKGAVGDAAKAAVMPSTDPKAEPDPEGVAEKANEQVYLGGDAAVAPEAVPAPAPPVPKKKAKKTPVKIAHAKIPPAPPKKAAKKAAAKKSTKKSKKAALEKSVEKAGWTLIRSRYDDGGYSGGSTDRPDLQKSSVKYSEATRRDGATFRTRRRRLVELELKAKKRASQSNGCAAPRNKLDTRGGSAIARSHRGR